MVRVRCSHCPQVYQVSEDQLGRQAICKKCQHTFTLEMAADETSIPPVLPLSTVPASGGTTALPRKLGQYLLKRKLGAGAMGEVWLAHDETLERDAAIKLMAPGIALDPLRRQRFEREAKTAARLLHPNTVAVYSFGVEGEHAYLAMELVDGSSLDRIVAEHGPLPWREATRAICDAAKGLAAAHEIGLVHRDVKPANLMRTAKGVTKVVDFGLARAALSNTHLTQDGAMLGTPAYMAPEQWVSGELDARSDLYSLICTYYFLLTASLPFDAPSTPALGYQHRYEPFPDPRQSSADLPFDVCRILTRGSQKDPAHRYQTAGDLVAELESLLSAPDQPYPAWPKPSGSAKLPPSQNIQGVSPFGSAKLPPSQNNPPQRGQDSPPSPVLQPIPAYDLPPPQDFNEAVSANEAAFAQEPELKLAPVNSYAAPVYVPKPRRSTSRQQVAPELARQRLLVPAIGLATGAFLCLGYALLTIGMFAISPQEFLKDVPPPTQAAERAGYFFGMYSVMIFMTAVPLVVAAGTTSMFRGRGRLLAMIGAIAAVLPCNPCCFVGLPFGIWALMVLNQPEVKAAMR